MLPRNSGQAQVKHLMILIKKSVDLFTLHIAPLNEEASLRATFNSEILFRWILGEYQTMNLLPGLARAQCSVLVLAGDLDPVCPIDASRDIVAALPEQFVQFEQFHDCGHGVWRDNPNTAFLRLRQFILEC